MGGCFYCFLDGFFLLLEMAESKWVFLGLFFLPKGGLPQQLRGERDAFQLIVKVWRCVFLCSLERSHAQVRQFHTRYCRRNANVLRAYLWNPPKPLFFAWKSVVFKVDRWNSPTTWTTCCYRLPMKSLCKDQTCVFFAHFLLVGPW